MEILYFIIIGVLIFLFIKFYNKFKFPKISAICVVTGGVKSGKSAVSVALTIQHYKRNHLLWKIKCFFIKFINFFRSKDKKVDFPEEPFLYSNIPLRYIKYIPVTREHLLRQRRFNFKSVVFIDEASLVADSQLIHDKHINAELLKFFKLFGHETHGGKCIFNSHCITDLHYALKRCTSNYFYIHHITKYTPFVVFGEMREERYSEDNSTINTYNEDVEETLKHFIMKKSTFKKYDCFCYSYLTDHLEHDTNADTIYHGKNDSLKAEEIVSFRPEFYNLKKKIEIEKEILNNEKENN